VFTNDFGGAVDPRNLLRVIYVAAKVAGVERIGVHTLHSAADGWLEQGVHNKAVADLLAIRVSPSRVTSTGTPVTKRHGLRSTAGGEHSDYECCCATYPHRVWREAVPDFSETASHLQTLASG
jgi:site-specific recombinase XerD